MLVAKYPLFTKLCYAGRREIVYILDISQFKWTRFIQWKRILQLS